MLKLKKVSVGIEDKEILHSIDVTFEKGKTYAIMGPNGSGKSTLASTVMGHPLYEVTSGTIEFNGEDIVELEPFERSKKGLFLSFQSPLSLTGVNIYQLLRYALDGAMDPLEIRNQVKKYAKDLHINEELLSRSLNDGFSGGEKKKMEVLQAAILNPSLAFFDEVDTGVDVDALKTIAEFISTLKSPDKTFVFITHYNRILQYVRPDVVIVLNKGNVAAIGDIKLAHTIEKEGYTSIL